MPSPTLWMVPWLLVLRATGHLDVGDGDMATDAECKAGEDVGEECAMRMLQMRGRKVNQGGLQPALANEDEDEAAGNCQTYGCTEYRPSQSCQCNTKCTKFGSCCTDYKEVCVAETGPHSCALFGCGKYDGSQPCQCNALCHKYGNCCEDYVATCNAEPGSCQAYGCGEYDRSRSCQCNSKCAQFGNCCKDYLPVCASGAATCQAYGCSSFDGTRACQCNPLCEKYGNCCPDYHAQCAAPASSGSCSTSGCGRYDESQQCQCNHQCAKYGNCCHDYHDTCTALPPGKIHGHPSLFKRYPQHEGFTLTLVEEFDTPINLNGDPIWTWSDGGLLEGQIRYVEEAISFEDGKMKISVDRRKNDGSCSNAEASVIPHKALTSGEFRSKHNMFRYGIYEARIKAPEVQPGNPLINGNFVATMFLFRDGKFKHWREIDVEITGDGFDTLHTNVLHADHTPEWNPSMGEEMDFEVGKNVRAGFHTYAIEWLPHRIRWFFDGRLIREKLGGKIPIPDLSVKVMMNLWVFDDRALFGGKEIENNRFPMTSEYDWFRFYRWDGETQYPCSGLGTQCLGADDRYLSSNNPCDGIPQEGTVYGEFACSAKCGHG